MDADIDLTIFHSHFVTNGYSTGVYSHQHTYADSAHKHDGSIDLHTDLDANGHGYKYTDSDRYAISDAYRNSADLPSKARD